MSTQRNSGLGEWAAFVLAAVAIAAGSIIVTGQITIPNTFVNGTVADGPQVNANFTALGSNALNRTGGTMTGDLTFAATKAIIFTGSTSGTLTVKGPAIAGATTLTLPGGTTDFSATGGTSQFVKQSSAGAALTVAAMAESELPSFIDWTDYSGTSTISGFTGAVTKTLNYTRVGKKVFVEFHFDGTSNSTAMAFTVPLTSATLTTGGFSFGLGDTADNGARTATAGVCTLASNSTTVTCYPTPARGNWTAANLKLLESEFWYQVP